MASPQVEHYTRISNELFEAYINIAKNLSPYENAVWLCIFRKTYGYHKKEDWIGLVQIESMTEIRQPHVARTKKKLLDKNMILAKDGKVGIQKDYSLWKTHKNIPKQVYPNGYIPKQVLPKQVTDITQTGNKTLPKQVDTKERKKILQKKVSAISKPEIAGLWITVYEKLTAKVKKYRPNHKLGNKDKDLKTIGLMFSRDKRDPNRTLKLLDWYPIGEPYIPEIFSVSSLREKYDKLDAAYQRNHKTTEKQIPKPELSECKQSIIRFTDGKYACDCKGRCPSARTENCLEKQAVDEIKAEKGISSEE